MQTATAAHVSPYACETDGQTNNAFTAAELFGEDAVVFYGCEAYGDDEGDEPVCVCCGGEPTVLHAYPNGDPSDLYCDDCHASVHGPRA